LRYRLSNECSSLACKKVEYEWLKLGVINQAHHNSGVTQLPSRVLQPQKWIPSLFSGQERGRKSARPNCKN